MWTKHDSFLGGGGGDTVEDSGRLVFILAVKTRRKVRMKVPVRREIAADLRFPGFVVISSVFGGWGGQTELTL